MLKGNWSSIAQLTPNNKLAQKMLGIYLLVVFVSSLLLNVALLLVFFRHKKTRTSFNKIVMMMTVFNILGSIQFPLAIHIIKRWSWSIPSCIINSFINFFLGCLQIYSTAYLSYFRYESLENPFNINKLNKKSVIKSIVIIVLLSSFWSCAPLLDWSYYSLSDSLVFCTNISKDKSFNVVSYNMGIFLFVFVLPFTIIIITNIKSVLIVKELRTYVPDRNCCLLNAQRKATFSLLVYMWFILTWLPYSVVLFYNSYNQPNKSIPFASNLSVAISRSSVVWSTILFIITNKKIRSKINCGLLYKTQTNTNYINVLSMYSLN